MPTFGNTYLSLADLRRQQNKNDEIADIIEILRQDNGIVEDAPVLECNEGKSHLTTIRTGLPSPTWRILYQGVQPTKSTTTQVRDTTGYMEDWAEIDAKLVERAKDPAKFRMNDAKAHIQGIMHTLATTIFYGNQSTNPERFTGLAPRFSSLSAQNGNQIIDGGGTASDNLSMWFVGWGENTCHLLYPEGSQAGLTRKDLGEETKENTDGSLYRVYREMYGMDVGLTLRDWRAVARIANIRRSTLTADGATGAKLIDLMIQAYYRLDFGANTPSSKLVIYANRTLSQFLHTQAVARTSAQLSLDQYEGKPILSFMGIPIRRCDALLETEARVV
jgi:hypothetical protein